ncbi:MAG: siderophore-interacting protein [Rhizobiaceae bacterium]
MTELNSNAELELKGLPACLDQIEARLVSFQATATHGNDRIDFAFPFGQARFEMERGRLRVSARSPDRDGLARVRDLVATAIRVHAKDEGPRILWHGDLSGETQLPQFREMTVESVVDVTPRMRRFRLSGEDLARFERFGGMHVRMLFPTREVPDPDWPTLGPDGLTVWPPAHRKPVPRAYTIRRLDVQASWMDIDFVRHDGESVGARWADMALAGDRIGLMGPVGRPVPQDRQWYVLGADETGLPALSRMLETLPASTEGVAWIEVPDPMERQEIANRTAIEVNWIYRDGSAAGADYRLSERVLSTPWPDNRSCFGWFAAEARATGLVRHDWREVKGLGRHSTLAASYWSRGTTGFMAGT